MINDVDKQTVNEIILHYKETHGFHNIEKRYFPKKEGCSLQRPGWVVYLQYAPALPEVAVPSQAVLDIPLWMSVSK